MLAMALFSIYMARSLGRDIYGLISIAIGVFGIATIVGDMGLNVASTRYTAIHLKKGEHSDINAILKASLGIKASSALLLLLALWILSPAMQEMFHKPVGTLIRVMALAVVFNLPASAFQAIIRGHQRMDLYAGANMVRDSFWLVSSIALVSSGYGVYGAVVGYLVGQMSWFCANAVAYFMAMHSPATTGDIRAAAKKLVMFGLPVITMDLMIFVYNWTDTFVIGIFRPTWEVSCYNISFGMVNMVMVVIASVSTVMLPLFSEKSVVASSQELSEVYYRITKVISLIVYPMLTALALFEPYIMYIYGGEYIPGITALWILVIWGYFRPYGNMSNTMLTALGRQKLVLYTTTVVALLNLVMNLILVPFMGMNGAALASTVSISGGTLVSLHFLRTSSDVSVEPLTPLKIFIVSILVALPFYSMLYITSLYISITSSLVNLVIILGIVLTLYWLTFIYICGRTGVIDREDRGHLTKATASIPLAKTVLGLVLPPM